MSIVFLSHYVGQVKYEEGQHSSVPKGINKFHTSAVGEKTWGNAWNKNKMWFYGAPLKTRFTYTITKLTSLTWMGVTLEK